MASISVSLDRNADRHDVKLLKRELDTDVYKRQGS